MTLNQQDFKIVDLNRCDSLEDVDWLSETQLKEGENSNWIIWQLKNLTL